MKRVEVRLKIEPIAKMLAVVVAVIILMVLIFIGCGIFFLSMVLLLLGFSISAHNLLCTSMSAANFSLVAADKPGWGNRKSMNRCLAD